LTICSLLSYIKVKRQACEFLGFDCIVKQETGVDSGVHGVIVQLPIPKHIDSHSVLETLPPHKDVDGLHPFNVGKLFLGRPTIVPAAPLGILELLKTVPLHKLDGKLCVVVGRGNLVAKPTAALLLASNFANMSVVVVDGKWAQLESLTRQADVLVVASNQAEFITPDMLKDGVILVDTGVHYLPDASARSGMRMRGNVHHQSYSRAAHYTPVPGGVGPMTVACLLKNTLQAAQRQLGVLS